MPFRYFKKIHFFLLLLVLSRVGLNQWTLPLLPVETNNFLSSKQSRRELNHFFNPGNYVIGQTKKLQSKIQNLTSAYQRT